MNPDLANLKAIAMTNAAKIMAQQEAPQYGAGAAQNATIAPTLAPAWNADIAVKKSNVQGYNDQAALENQKIDLQAQEQRAKAMADPANYKRVKNNKDGGWNFFDPEGKPISAYDYANAIGSTPAEVLKDSENPIDTGYQTDFEDLQAYFQASMTKDTDKDAKDYWDAVNDEVEKKRGIKLWTMKPADVIASFKKAYPTVYGTQNKGVKVGSLYMPRPNLSGEDSSETSDW